MSVKLRKLIDHYEAEKAALIAQRDECLEEWDYGMAHQFTKALAVAHQQLQVLQQLQDPIHGEKMYAAERISRIEALLQADTTAGLHQYYQPRLDEERNKLVALQAQSLDLAPPARPTHLHEALSKLISKQISAFILMIDPAQRLHCNFHLVRRTLLITLPEVRRHRTDYVMRKKHLRFFQRLGFHLYDCKDKLLLYTDFMVPGDIDKIKTLLARMVLDGFYHRELFKHAYISYREPDMR